MQSSKKDKKEYDYYDNKTKMFWGNFVGGLIWALTFAVIYGLYELYLYLFS